MKKFYNTRTHCKGFSLIELAVSMLILSVVLGGYLSYKQKSNFDEADLNTKAKIEVIQHAILSFYNQNGYIPCPASRIATGSTMGQATDCSTGPAAGTVDFGSGTDRVRTGAVPVQNLNISTENMFDGWGNRFLYTVVRDLATSARLFNNFTSTTNVITIREQGSITPMTTELIAYVLVSVGSDGRGGYNKNGTLIRNCTGASVFNCDGDEIFIYNFRDMTNTDLSGANDFVRFDDYINWQTYRQVKSEGDFSNSGRGFGMRFLLAGNFQASGVNLPSSPTFSYITFPNVIWDTTKNVVYNPGASTIELHGPGTFTVRSAVVACGINVFESFHYNYIFATSRPGTAEFSGAAGANTSCSPSFSEYTVTVPFGNVEYISIYVESLTTNAVDGIGRSVNVAPGNYFSYVEVWEETK